MTVAVPLRNASRLSPRPPPTATSAHLRGGLLRGLEGLCAFVFLVTFAQIFWPPDTYFSGGTGAEGGGVFGESHVFDTSTIAALYGFLAVAAYAYRGRLALVLRSAWPILALTLLALVSAFWSDDPNLVIRRTASVSATTLFGLYLVARGDLDSTIALLVKVFAFAVAGSFAVAVLTPHLLYSTNEGYTTAWRGAFTDKNQLGVACGLGIIVSVYAFHRRLGPRWLAAFTVVGSLVLLKLSNSKTPIVVMLAVLYAAMVCGALRRRTGFGAIVGYVFLVVGLAAIAALVIDPAGALEALGRDPTLTNRTPLWHLAWGYIERRPWLGHGYEAFWSLTSQGANEIWATVHWKAPHAHNAWLEMALGLGIVGVSLTALVWSTVLVRFARIAIAPEGRHAVFCTALLAGVFVENLTEYAFFRRGEMMWLLFVVGFVELGREIRDRRAARPKFTGLARPAMPPRSRNKPASA